MPLKHTFFGSCTPKKRSSKFSEKGRSIIEWTQFKRTVKGSSRKRPKRQLVQIEAELQLRQINRGHNTTGSMMKSWWRL